MPVRRSATVIVVAIYDATGAYDAMWWLSIALALAAAAVHLPILERRAPSTA